MGLPVIQPVQDLLAVGLGRLATCWTIARTDGVALKFTNHDLPLVVDGDTFTPMNGVSVSAKQKKTGLEVQNFEAVGIIDDTSVTHEDLRAGRYRNAQITEKVVDWRFPFNGTVSTMVYWVGEMAFSNGLWTAQMAGVTRFLNNTVGNVYSRTCPANLGDARCKRDLSDLTTTGVTVDSADAAYPRKIFTATSIGGFPAFDYNFGVLTWTSGANIGIISEIKDSDNVNFIFTFQVSLPFNIQAGDEFTIVVGCNKQRSRCIGRFNNVINFRGFPTMPGTDNIVRAPSGQTIT